MAETFAELGLRQELVAAAAARGYTAPSAIQRGAIPVLRRGGNAVLHATAGSGVVAAYGLALVDRLAGSAAASRDEDTGTDAGEEAGDAGPPDEGAGAGAAGVAGEGGAVEGEGAEAARFGTSAGPESAEPASGPADLRGGAADPVAHAPRALVVVPTPESAARTAASIAAFARAVELRAAAAGPGWSGAGSAHILVLDAGDALRRVQASLLKLHRLEALVLDGVLAILELVGRDAVEAVMVGVAKDAQRVLTAEAATPELDDFVERHVRRALHVPARTVAEGAPARGVEPAVEVGYAVVAPDERTAAAAALLAPELAGPAARFHCRSAEAARELADALALRGYSVLDLDADGAAVTGAAPEPAQAAPAPTPVSLTVPLDAGTLAARHGGGGVVLVEARELPHLRRSAAEARLTLRPLHLPGPPEDDEVERFRDRLREAARTGDLNAQILLLEPLLTEMSPLEVAAAATSLLREAAPAPPAPAPAAPTAGPPPPAWVRLFISVGARDQLRPGDLVGAIAGEAGVPGTAVGRIEIRDTFSIAEVAPEHAERILQALNGITLKGRAVRADYDRKGTTPAPRRRPAGPRRERQR